MIKKKAKYIVAVVGATGAVGNEMIATLEQRNFPVEKLRLFASERSEGKTLEFQGNEIPVENLNESSFKGIDIALFLQELKGQRHGRRLRQNQAVLWLIIQASGGWTLKCRLSCLRLTAMT